MLSSNERRVLNSFIGSECTILDLTDALLDYQVRLGSVEITCVRPGKLHGRAKDSMLPLADLTPLFFVKKKKAWMRVMALSSNVHRKHVVYNKQRASHVWKSSVDERS